MVAVITAVLAGSTAALVAILISDHSLAAALVSGGLVALIVLVALTRFSAFRVGRSLDHSSYSRAIPASAAPVWRTSRPKPSTGPSAPEPCSAPAAARWAPQARMSAVKS